MMNVSLTNEVCGNVKYIIIDLLTGGYVQGPVTLTLDSRKFEYIEPQVKAKR